MSIRLAIAAAAFLSCISPAYATTTISGSYTAVDTGTGSYLPTINDDGGSFLPGSFSEALSLGSTTTPTTFIQVGPPSGPNSVGTISGSIAIGLTLTDPSNSPLTSFSYTTGGDAVTLSNGVLHLTANYNLFYGTNPQTDCIAWNTTNCTANDQTNTIGETVTATFADGTSVAINLYNWADWNMAPNISFSLVSGPTPQIPAPEPASIAVFGSALAGLYAARRRWLGNPRSPV